MNNDECINKEKKTHFLEKICFIASCGFLGYLDLTKLLWLLSTSFCLEFRVYVSWKLYYVCVIT